MVAGEAAAAEGRADDTVLAGGPVPPRLVRAAGLALYALLVYVPILLMHPGKVDADTKSYLYLDPSRFLERAASIWDPSIGFGTLSHQTVGYLFPMGPFFWVTEDVLGLPAWVAQRLWLGTLILAAGLGVRYLLRALGARGPGVPVAMLAYSFSPYVLGYSAIYSVMLSPWSALPWWIAFVIYAMRRGGWKYPALLAVTVQLAGALNGSALLFSLLGPLLYIPFAVVVLREATWRRAWTVVWRVGALSFFTSLWWFIPLAIEGQYGQDILRYTESVEIVSVTSLPYEVLRGLGNWYFYGRDNVALWADARVDFTQRPLFILTSLAIPTMALLATALVRWRHRAYFVLLALVGIAIAVGSEPYGSPSILGNLYKNWALNSNLGFALRNTGRAAPLVILSLSVLLGVGVTAFARWMQEHRRAVWGVAVAGLVGLVCVVNAVPALSGKYYSKSLERDDSVPGYWERAIADLDARSNDTRVLTMPGTDFASYRWGDTRDPIEPGLMDRPYAARELVPWGSEASANLLQSLDRRLQEGDDEPQALAEIARLMGVGDVVLRNDLATDRWALVPAENVWTAYGEEDLPGLGEPRRYGNRIPGRLRFPPISDLTKPTADTPDPPPVAVLPVEDAIPIVRAKSTRAPVVVDGDGEGVVDLSGAGLLDAERLLLYAAPYEHDPSLLRDLPDDALLVVTDSNRRRGMRWAGISDNYGYTEQRGEKPMRDDPSDQRMQVFPDATDTSRTVAVLDGVESVRATRYGTEFGFQPTDRPARALDGDVETAWQVDAGRTVGAHTWEVDLEEPVTTDRLDLVQRFTQGSGPPLRRYISRVTLRFDDGPEMTRVLGPASRTAEGQELRFPRRTFSKVAISFDGVPEARARTPRARNPVGFAEVRIVDDAPGAEPVRATETMRLPRTLLDGLGERSAEHPLAIVMSRERTMDQAALARQFVLPTARSFSFSGTAVLGGQADDDVIDRAFGLPDSASGGVTATSDDRYEQLEARASSAIDGDLTTAWRTPVDLVNTSMRVRTAAPVTFDHLDLAVVADGRHSIPRKLEIISGGTEQAVDLPPIPVRAPGGVARVPVDVPTITGDDITVRIRAFQPVRQNGRTLPVGIAELGIPGVGRAAPNAELPGECEPSLVTIDGKPFPVRITGTVQDALDGRRLQLTPCDPAATVDLGAGEHTVRAAVSPLNDTGFDVQRIVLASGAGGDAVPASELVTSEAASGRAAPRIRVEDQSRTSMKVQVDATDEPFWMVLGQSYNKGWTATVDGRDLGTPELVDGFANGWRVRPSSDGGPMTITLTWAPQRAATIAGWVSLAAGLACLVIIVVASVRRRRRHVVDDEADPPALAGWRAVGPAPARLLSTGATVATVAVMTIGAALLVRPSVGLLVGALTLLAILRPRWRVLLRFGPPLILVGIAIYMAAGQYLENYPDFFDWPTYYAEARNPAWIAVMLLVADAVIEIARRISRRDTDGDAPAGSPTAEAPAG